MNFENPKKRCNPRHLPSFQSGIFPTADFLYAGGRLRRPPVPPWSFTTKNVGNGTKQISKHSTGSQKYENKKARNESNKCNPYAGANNYHCLGFPSRSKHSACRPLGLPASVFRSPGLRPSGNPLMKQCQAAVCLST